MPSNPISGSTSTNIYLSSIISGGYRWDDGATLGTNITYYFAPFGIDLGGGDGSSMPWSGTEKTAYANALNAWASVANLSFTEVFDPNDADLIEFEYMNFSSGVLAAHETPYTALVTNGQAWGYFNIIGTGFTNNGLQAGGYGYLTLLHELGHALGLTHPHSTEGGSTIFPGVTGAFNSYGDNNLNQGIYTVMSYNDGWDQVQNPLGNGLVNYGYSIGPSALDIAAIQLLYGANTTIAGGDNTYYLPTTNASGTGWKAIWDTGGIDTIVQSGSQAATINLTAATLDNTPTGGGMVNYATGIYGGYTIANGVIIENAIGGSGNDTIVGNIGNNTLDGGLGNDSLDGGSGSDSLYGGIGLDTLLGGADNDYLFGGSSNDSLDGGSGSDNLYGDAGADTLNGGIGDDYLYYDTSDVLIGGTGYDWALAADYYGTGANFTFTTTTGIEGVQGTAYNDKIDASALTTAVTIYGHYGADSLLGGSGNDYIYFDNQDLTSGQVLGGAGYDWVLAWDGLPTRLNLLAMQAEGGYGGNSNDTLDATGITTSVSLIGNGGNDQFIGGSGNDYLYIDSLDTSIDGGAGYDWAIVWDNSNITINLLASRLEGVQSAAGNDYLNAAGVNSSVSLIGNGGNDTLIGGNGDDYLYVDHFDSSIQGGAGYDWVISWDNFGITLDMAAAQVEGFLGIDGNDNINGTNATWALNIYGYGGADSLTGGSAADYLFGGDGNDTLNGNNGSDIIDGGAGFDNAVYAGVAANYTLTQINATTWTVTGFGSTDTLYNIEKVQFDNSVVLL